MAMTNPQKFQKIIDAFTGNALTQDEATEIVEWCHKNIESLANKAEKDAVKRAEKKATTDVLVQKVKAVLTEDAQTIEEIVEAVGEVEGIDEVTPGKVRSALSFLVRQDMAHKDEIKVEVEGKNKRKVVYTA